MSWAKKYLMLFCLKNLKFFNLVLVTIGFTITYFTFFNNNTSSLVNTPGLFCFDFLFFLRWSPLSRWHYFSKESHKLIALPRSSKIFWSFERPEKMFCYTSSGDEDVEFRCHFKSKDFYLIFGTHKVCKWSLRRKVKGRRSFLS